MQIISLRRGFDADHSSSTYEFFARSPLKAAQKEAIRALTGEDARRRLQFHYEGEWRNIPPEWPSLLLTMGYEIMVSESYDWWTVQLSLPASTPGDFELYEFDSDTGLTVERTGEHILLTFYGLMLDEGICHYAFDEGLFGGLHGLFQSIRDEILAGDLSVLAVYYRRYGFWIAEGDDDEEFTTPPAPPETLSKSVQLFARLLTTI